MNSFIVNTGVSLPKRGTQNYTILMALERGERLTVASALSRYGIYALSQRCGELRNKFGWPIDVRIVDTPNGARVAEYSMRRGYAEVLAA